jgi:hypothetical protein
MFMHMKYAKALSFVLLSYFCMLIISSRGVAAYVCTVTDLHTCSVTICEHVKSAEDQYIVELGSGLVTHCPGGIQKARCTVFRIVSVSTPNILVASTASDIFSPRNKVASSQELPLDTNSPGAAFTISLDFVGLKFVASATMIGAASLEFGTCTSTN